MLQDTASASARSFDSARPTTLQSFDGPHWGLAGQTIAAHTRRLDADAARGRRRRLAGRLCPCNLRSIATDELYDAKQLAPRTSGSPTRSEPVRSLPPCALPNHDGVGPQIRKLPTWLASMDSDASRGPKVCAGLSHVILNPNGVCGKSVSGMPIP